jgi:hypothetical protein
VASGGAPCRSVAHHTPEKEIEDMVLQRSARGVALAAGLALALPALAHADSGGPAARAAGGDAPPLNPAVVGVPIQRTDAALSSAADAIDSGDGAAAAGPLTASRRHLIRSYTGAKYLIAHPPAPPAEEGSAASAKPQTFVAAARKAIRASHRRKAGKGGWIKAKASQDDAAGPVIADGPTAVFNVLTSQYNAATAAAGMASDTKGQLLAKVKTTLDTAIVLRNRLVKVVAAAEPPAPAEEARANARAAQEEEGPTYAAVMPGLVTLIDDEVQQMQTMVDDAAVPAESKAALTAAMAADKKIEALVNQTWPPAPAD